MVIGYYNPNQVQPHELVRHLVFDRLLDLHNGLLGLRLAQDIS